jgi:hypothetical protein
MSSEINCADLQNRCLGQEWCEPGNLFEGARFARAYAMANGKVLSTLPEEI